MTAYLGKDLDQKLTMTNNVHNLQHKLNNNILK